MRGMVLGEAPRYEEGHVQKLHQSIKVRVVNNPKHYIYNYEI